MASKKGISVTIGILAAITIASFVIWTIPQNNQATFVVSDYESHLDGVKAIHQIIMEDLDDDFQNLINGDVTFQEYIDAAEGSSTQINSQIIQLVQSEVNEEWSMSYSYYMEALKNYNSHIRETIVAANKIAENVDSDIQSSLEKSQEFKDNMYSLIEQSDKARP
ncbi:MAG: hypothetical protein DWQ18_07630 [Crenarchaeota archaeon]|nr:MAG: hypothetical protein DWQ17_02155 [Thermoproteota archaeon]RDJ33037.1 MAG: hypothetical protein DWQ18_07630 [Thermoproteota archaeon]RDJ35761.1 MAG: hypothetical protein DWQ13_09295 [Thermoproteota archaeon]RDJ36459.1 MAG: hypothetical protein DWQ19_07690 [Thermoproteota archaeon]